MGNQNGIARRLPADQLSYLLDHTDFDEKGIRKIYKHFRKYVTNGNLNREEFIDMYGDLCQTRHARVIASHMFRTFDADANSELDFVEFFIGFWTTTHGTLIQQIEMIFKIYDIDGDGSLTLKEIQEIVRLGQKFGVVDKKPKDVAKLFNHMDRNNDGSLSMKEFVQGCLNDPTLLKAIGF